MTSVIPEASTATPNPQDQRATEPAALYRLHDAAGTLLYIGVTGNPDRRFKQHRDTKPWWPQVAKKTIAWHPSRDRALAEEAAAIKAETPVYNIDHNPAAPSYQWPPAGMPDDRIEAIERQASMLPASEAEGIRRAAWEGFTRAQLTTAGQPKTGTICHVYPGLCTSVDGEAGDQVDEHGRHYDHGGRTISVPGLENEHDPEIWAEFIHLSSSTPKIGFMGADLTPAQVREKAAQLRQFADEADALADQVEAFMRAGGAGMTTTAEDRAINERVAADHPHMAPILDKPTDRCTYEGGPAVTVRTGKLGNRYGLCASCKASHDRTDIATRIMEPFRIRLGNAGLLDERAEEFIDAVIVVGSAAEDPEATIRELFRRILDERDAERAEAAGTTA